MYCRQFCRHALTVLDAAKLREHGGSTKSGQNRTWQIAIFRIFKTLFSSQKKHPKIAKIDELNFRKNPFFRLVKVATVWQNSKPYLDILNPNFFVETLEKLQKLTSEN